MTYMALQSELADCRHAYTDMKERALTAEAALAMMQAEMNKIARNLGEEIELLARADTAEAALARVELARDEARDYMTQVVVERNAAIARAETAEAALAERDTPCVWTRAGDGTYRDCHGGYWNPDDKGQFCPCCGHPIAVVEVAP